MYTVIWNFDMDDVCIAVDSFGMLREFDSEASAVEYAESVLDKQWYFNYKICEVLWK